MARKLEIQPWEILGNRLNADEHIEIRWKYGIYYESKRIQGSDFKMIVCSHLMERLKTQSPLVAPEYIPFGVMSI